MTDPNDEPICGGCWYDQPNIMSPCRECSRFYPDMYVPKEIYEPKEAEGRIHLSDLFGILKEDTDGES